MKKEPFLGWRVVGAAFTAQFLANASTFGVYGVFVVPLSQEFAVSEGRFGYGFSLAILVMGLMGPFIGRWIDRGAARSLMVTGVSLAGGGLLLLSRATEFWQLAVVFCGVIGLGTALYGQTPTTTLVANWFVRRRGLALGFTVAGATVAGLVGPPTAAFLIDELGWRSTVAILGSATLLIGLPVFAWAVISKPELVGQHPDGEAPEGDDRAASEAAEVDAGQLIRDSRLWLLSIGFGLVFTSPIVLILTLVPFGEELGFTRQNASFFFATMAPFSILGKVVFGALADRVPVKLAVWIVVIGNMLVWICFLTAPSYPVFLAIGVLYGAAIGAAGPLQGVALGMCFGREAFGRASGIGGLATLPLISASPAIAGALRDATGSYHAVFLLQAVLVVLGGVLLSFVRFPKRATR